MQNATEKENLEFPLIISVRGLPIENNKKLDAVWRAENLQELFGKIRKHTNLRIKMVTPSELLTDNKYRIPFDDILRYQREENLALIHYLNQLLVMRLELYTPPSKVLEMFLSNVCETMTFYSVDSDRSEILSLEHMVKDG